MYLYSIYLVLNLVMCPIRYRISTNKHPRTDTNKRPIPRNRCPLELPPPPLTFINSRDTRLVSLLWGGGKGKNRFYSYFIYNFLDFNHSRRIVSFSSSYLYLYMLAEFLFCFFICSFDFFFIPVSNNMTKREKLTERYWYVSTILCIWQGTLNTFKRKLIPFLSQLSLLLFKTVPGY